MSTAAGVAALALCHAGLSGLCLAMNRHQTQAWQRSLSPIAARSLRIGGWMLLIAAFAICLRHWGSAGPVVWFGLLSLTAASIVLTLSYAPRLLSRCAVSALPVGIVLLVVSI